MRIVVADDHLLLRAGLVELLGQVGFDVVGQAGDADDLIAVVRAERPDVVLLDIRMPPTHTLEGLIAAGAIREEFGSAIGIILLSQYVETRYLDELLRDGADGVGYLLKDRIGHVRELTDAIDRVGNGGSAIDPHVVEQLLRRPGLADPLALLTEREREVLAAMAEGRSNQSISTALNISEKTVESCTSRIFVKLAIEQTPEHHRRVKAVLAFLRASPA